MANSKKDRTKQNDRWGTLVPIKRETIASDYRGRPSVITPAVLERLREAFLIGCDDGEACLHAEISTATLYNHQKSNPSFLEWKEALKRNPFLKARKTIVDHLERDPEFALRYMERKKKAEFSPSAKLTIEDTGGAVLDDDQKAKIGGLMEQHLKKIAERNSSD